MSAMSAAPERRLPDQKSEVLSFAFGQAEPSADAAKPDVQSFKPISRNRSFVHSASSDIEKAFGFSAADASDGKRGFWPTCGTPTARQAALSLAAHQRGGLADQALVHPFPPCHTSMHCLVDCIEIIDIDVDNFVPVRQNSFEILTAVYNGATVGRRCGYTQTVRPRMAG